MDTTELEAMLADLDAASRDATLDTTCADGQADAPAFLDGGGTLPPSLSLLDDDVVWWMVDEDDPRDARVYTSEGLDAQPHPALSPTVTEAATSNAVPDGAYARVVASRRRAKSELEHLRRRVEDLERQLEQARAQAQPPSTPPEKHEDKLAGAVDQFWQRLAQSEREARQRAVVENLRLRGQLEAQLRTARSLEKLLHKRPYEASALGTTSCHDAAFSKRLRVDHDGEEDVSAVYEALLADVDKRYAQTDAVLEESGLAHRRETFQDANVRFAAKGDDESSFGRSPTTALSSCVEFVTAHVVPFSYELTQDVAWRALQAKSIPLANGVYETVGTNEDGSIVKALFTIHTKLRGSDVVSRARFVAKRYVEEHRCVVVWALASTVRGGILKSHRVELLEEGWSAISPLSENDTTTTTPLCLTQACGRLRPRMVVRVGSKLDELVGLLTDVFLDCYHDTQQGLYDFTGRMLLDEAAQQR